MENTKQARFEPAVLLIGTLLLAFAFIWAFRSSVPIVSDEIGYLAIAKYIVTGEALNLSSIPVYRFGQALLLVPAFLLGSSASESYQIGTVISCLFAAAVPPMLVAIARRLGWQLTWPVLFASFLVAVFPTYIYQAATVWPETSFRFFFLLSIYLVASAWKGHRLWWWLAAALSVVWLYALHPRALAIGVVMAGLLAFGRYRGRISVSTLTMSLLLLGGGYAAVATVQQHFVTALWSFSGSDAREISKILRSILTGDGLIRMLVVTAGQSWMLIVAGFGLYAVGLAHAYQRARVHEVARVALVFALAASVAVFCASVLQMVRFERVDHVIYSRYNDGASTIFVWLGILLVLQGGFRSRAVAWMAVLFAMLAVALLLVAPALHTAQIVAPNVPSLLWTGFFAPFHTMTLPKLLALGTLGTLAAALLILATPPRVGAAFLIILVGASDVVVRSYSWQAHAARQHVVDNSTRILSAIQGEIAWDKSAGKDQDVVIDQYAATGRIFARSNIAEGDLPDGAAAIVRDDFRRAGYTCVARLSYRAVILVRGEAEPNCGGMEVPEVVLSSGEPLEVSSGHVIRGSGWSNEEAWGRWTSGYAATLNFKLDAPVAERAVLELDAVAYVEGSPSSQRVVLRINDQPYVEWNFTADSQRQLNRVAVPAGVTSLKIEFQLPDARSPQQAGASGDTRILGLGLVAVCLTEADVPCLGPGVAAQ